MRVLFVTWAWGSHFNPLVPFGWALRGAGHEVMVVSHPSFAPTIAGSGLPALLAGADVDTVAILQDTLQKIGWHQKRQGRNAMDYGKYGATELHSAAGLRRGMTVLRIAAHSAEAMADDTVRFTDGWRPDAVVYEPFGFLGPVLAARLDVPAVRLLWTVDFLSSIGDVEDELLGELATRIGAPRVNAVGDITLDPCPPRLQVDDDLERQPMRYVPYNGPAVEPSWLRRPKRRTRICVTFGTSIDGLALNSSLLGPSVVRALAEHDVEIVVAVVESQREQFGELPDNVISLGRVPLDQALADCDAIVHQGGGGTIMTAMKNALPQFVMPILPDTMFNAQHVAATGAGTYLWGGDATPERLSAELNAFLDGLDGYREAAVEMHAEHLAMPTPADAVRFLQERVR
ncbi:nucleotide disphospho-sugar-binding domain-containing protein [Actinoplanes sp. NPDC051411]|uniref:nucleotide disphospho-sugar-binding domain-containing protein n=1 Tax=Actinoplanes sp. NPDC051411 TaxID=3155522 RepID=UPI003445A245